MADGKATDVYFNPYDEAYRANPYPHYKAQMGGRRSY
jgi:hypothetical protein